jgi:hypothetical protein
LITSLEFRLNVQPLKGYLDRRQDLIAGHVRGVPAIADSKARARV